MVAVVGVVLAVPIVLVGTFNSYYVVVPELVA